MKFNIAGFTYRLEQAAVIGGDPDLLGRIDRTARMIQLAEDCPADRRLEIFLHEYTHGWLFHVPRPATDEEWCDFVAALCASLFRDLGRQGGVNRLLSGGTGIVAPAAQPSVMHGVLSPIERRGIRCEQHDQPIAPGSVVRDAQETHPRLGCPFVRLSYYCESGSHVVTWTEMVSPLGVPTGVEIDRAESITGEACTRFCREHPRETGLHFHDDAA